MKVLYCRKCRSLVKLTHTHMRSCECGEVRGRYCKDRHRARISQNSATISLAIDTPSFWPAIKNMQRQKKHRPKTDKEEYKNISCLSVYVRPNCGPGNPNSRPLKTNSE
jgi:hypothetical protein